jgi:hypothetical protein
LQALSVPLLNSLSRWERVGERALRLAPLVNYVPLPQPFSQREKGETNKNNLPSLIQRFL